MNVYFPNYSRESILKVYSSLDDDALKSEFVALNALYSSDGLYNTFLVEYLDFFYTYAAIECANRFCLKNNIVKFSDK